MKNVTYSHIQTVQSNISIKFESNPMLTLLLATDFATVVYSGGYWFFFFLSQNKP